MRAERDVNGSTKRLGAILAFALLAGCSARVIPVPTDVDAQMAQLGGLSPRPVAATFTPTVAQPIMPEPLQRTVSFAWDGLLEDGVARLAASVGYTFYVTAPTGTVPLPVSVAVKDVPAWQAFRALGEAAGTTATVRLFPARAQVQVVYHG
jgi:defect in organelle trafficking protein DotD